MTKKKDGGDSSISGFFDDVDKLFDQAGIPRSGEKVIDVEVDETPREKPKPPPGYAPSGEARIIELLESIDRRLAKLGG